MPIRVMFVCLGNICRSPLAQGIFEHLLRQRGLTDRFEVASSGTGSWHRGDLPDARMRKTAKGHGIDLDYQRAQQITKGDLSHYDHLYAMDRSIERVLLRMSGSSKANGRVQLFSDFDTDPEIEEVPDPYFDGRFEHVYEIVERTCVALLEALIDQYDLE